MLTGSYPMSVDAKARITLPAVFRKQLLTDDNKTIKLVPFGGCVNGFTPEGFKAFVDSLFAADGGLNPRDKEDVRLKRLMVSRAVEVDVDSAGRVALGKLDASRPGTREKFGLTGDVVVIGNDDRFEVWDASKWAAMNEDADDELDSLLYNC